MIDSKSAERMHRAGTLVAAAMICGSLIASGFTRASAGERPTTPTNGTLQIRVVDASGKAVPEAKIFASIWTKEKAFKSNRKYKCDDRGQAIIELPATLEIIRVWASHDGYAPMFGQLWPQAANGHPPLPKEFTYSLNKGTTMGGVIRNDEGQPIAGAKVEVRYESGGADFGAPAPTGYDDWLADNEDAKITDANGRWSLDNVPPGKGVVVRVKLSHSDYVNDTDWGGLQKEQGVTPDELRDKSATLVMHRGYVVKGRVTDPDDKPVKNAVVIWGDDPYFQEGSQEVRSDDGGNYHFPPLATGPMRITVAAQGWMPQMKKIEIAASLPAVDFKLQPGKKLLIKFVDATGKPIPKVGVVVDTWRGAKSIYTHRHPNVVNLQIPDVADNDGIYEWTWAPDDSVEYRFGKQGFATTTASVVAGSQEHVQILHPVFKITGSVSDAATGKPVESFRVVPLLHFTPDFPFLERQNAQDGKAGKFSMDFDRTDIEHGVQIEAPGYITFRTERRYRVGEPHPALKVQLKPSERYGGRVVDRAGRAVSGARVFVATKVQHLDLENLKDRDGDFSSNYEVAADEKGAFEIVPQMERYALVVVTPAGFAEVERPPTGPPGELRVRPWARVKGRVVQDGKPMAKCEVFLGLISFTGGDEPFINARQTATTAGDGSFAFERVPPIACRVRPHLHFSVESPLKSSRSVPLELSPGSETTIELGGYGAEITGRFVVDPPRDPFDYHFSLTYLVAKRPGINPPASLAKKGFDWRKGWSDSWFKSQEGGAYLNTLHHWFVKPDPDGKFRISGVPPGEYMLAVNLYGTTEGCLVHPVAQRVMQISVAAGRPTVDLGKVVIPIQNVLQVGDVAVNFDFVAPDGKPTNLVAQRGKYVLVDFWATWCGSCVAKLPEVDTLRKDFGVSKGLIVVGANLDTEPNTVREFLAKNPLPWYHAQLGDWSSTDVPKRYGISSVPAYVLVDPEGRVAAVEYSTDKVRERLNRLDSRR